jgi:hypothetical protein
MTALEATQRRQAEALEAGAAHAATCTELRGKLVDEETSRFRAESQISGYLERATCAEQENMKLSQWMDGLKSELQTERDANLLLRSEIGEMHQRMTADHVAEVALQAVERVTATERRLQRSLAETAEARAETGELQQVVATTGTTDADAAMEDISRERARARARADTSAATDSGRQELAWWATPIHSEAQEASIGLGDDTDPSASQAKLAVTEEALQQARQEANALRSRMLSKPSSPVYSISDDGNGASDFWATRSTDGSRRVPPESASSVNQAMSSSGYYPLRSSWVRSPASPSSSVSSSVSSRGRSAVDVRTLGLPSSRSRTAGKAAVSGGGGGGGRMQQRKQQLQQLQLHRKEQSLSPQESAEFLVAKHLERLGGLHGRVAAPAAPLLHRGACALSLHVGDERTNERMYLGDG